MKKIVLFLLFNLQFSIFNIMYAQAPQAIPYQAVARDNAGNLVSNQNISLRFSIHDSIANGTVVYQETHSTMTNQFGLFSVNIGQGTPVIGLFNLVTMWGYDPIWLQVEMDVTGGNNYLDMGTKQLLSVPYALFANKSHSSEVYDWHEDFIYNLYNTNTGNVGIGTTSPGSKLSVKGSMSIGDSLADKSGPVNGLRVQGATTIGDTGNYLSPAFPFWLTITNNGKLGKHIGGVKYEDITDSSTKSTGIEINIAKADTGDGCETDVEGISFVSGSKMNLKGTSDSTKIYGIDIKANSQSGGKGQFIGNSILSTGGKSAIGNYCYVDDLTDKGTASVFSISAVHSAIGSDVTLTASDSVTGQKIYLIGTSDSAVVTGQQIMQSGNVKFFKGNFTLSSSEPATICWRATGSDFNLTASDSVIGSNSTLIGGSDTAKVVGNNIIGSGSGESFIGTDANTQPYSPVPSALWSKFNNATGSDITISASKSVTGLKALLTGASDTSNVTGTRIIPQGSGKKFRGFTTSFLPEDNDEVIVTFLSYKNVFGSELIVKGVDSVTGTHIALNGTTDTTKIRGIFIDKPGEPYPGDYGDSKFTLVQTNDRWKSIVGTNFISEAPNSLTGNRLELKGTSDSANLVGVSVIPQGNGKEFIAFKSDPYAEDGGRDLPTQKTAIGSDFHLYAGDSIIGSRYKLVGTSDTTKIIGSSYEVESSDPNAPCDCIIYNNVVEAPGNAWTMVSHIITSDTAGGFHTILKGKSDTSILIGNKIEMQGTAAIAKGIIIDGTNLTMENERMVDGCEINLANMNADTARGVLVRSSNQNVNLGGDFTVSSGSSNIGIRSTAVGTGAAAIFSGTGGATGLLVTNGNVGIGTNSPSQKLDVSGTTRTTNFQMTSGATNNYILQSDASGNGSWVNPTSLSFTETDPEVSSSSNNIIPKWNGTTLVDGVITDNGTNVGIGTAGAPAAKLDVNGTAKIGTNGTTITYIIKATSATSPLAIAPNTTTVQTYTINNTATGSSVIVSPGTALSAGLVIAYARVSAANTVEVSYRNTTAGPINLNPGIPLYITVIQ